jgi:sterol desaturase/sphingolipid hydroxylase (fatty acid hydroxylase superfamily)
MNHPVSNNRRLNNFRDQIKCLTLFAPIIAVILTPCAYLSSHRWLVAALLFTSGWTIWTFTEYMVHRFWMHDTPIEKARPVADYHMMHHRQPTEMDITRLHRTLVWILVATLLLLSFLLSIYFLLVAGFVFGFSCYTMMHWVLHQSWSVKLFPRLHRFHLYHHCKYPNTCYGVTVDWWDLVFKTTPPDEPVLVKRITDFYFGRSDRPRTTDNRPHT